MSLGVGEIVGSLFIGWVVDKRGNRPTITCTVISVVLQTFFVLLFLWQNSYGVLTHVMTFIWGFSDGIVNTHVQDILGFEFAPDNVRPYSIFNSLQSVVVFVFLIIESAVVTRRDFFIYMGVTGALGIAMCSATYYFPFHEESAQEQGIISDIVKREEEIEGRQESGAKGEMLDNIEIRDL